MSQKSNDQTTTSSDDTKTQKSERPQTLGEENSLLQQTFQESSNSSSSLCHLKWATCFESLMQDGDGLRLFRTFLTRDNQANLAEFYIGCNGYKMAFAKSGPNLAKKFYRKLIKGDQLNLSKPVKKALVKALKNNQIDQFIFDDAQNEVETELRNVYYPMFLKSDIYKNYAEAEMECTRLESQSESPERWKEPAPAATQPENTRSAREVNATVDTDMSISFSSMSFMSEDKNRSRVDPLGFKNSVDQVAGKDAKHRQLETSHRNQSVDATDFEDNVKYVSVVSASLVDSSSRSFTSDPVNTDGMSFTSSSRDERDTGRQKGHPGRHPPSNKGIINSNKDMNFTRALQQAQLERPSRFNTIEADPERFFVAVEQKLLQLNRNPDGTAVVDNTPRSMHPIPGATSTDHRNFNRSHYQQPNDCDHLRALDESITRIDMASARTPKRNPHNITMPAFLSQDTHKRQYQAQHQPQYDSSGQFKLPLTVGSNAGFAPRQFSDHYGYRYGQPHQNHNRSFAQPNNQSFNNGQHFAQHPSHQNSLGMSRPNVNNCLPHPHQQYLLGLHPPVNPGRGPNNPQNSIFFDEKVKDWMCTLEEYDVGKLRGSGDVSEHSLRKSSHADRTKRACSSRQSKHSRVSELNASQSTPSQLSQSAVQDQNTPLFLNSTSTSNSTGASANTVVQVGHISSETSLSSAVNTSASAPSAPPSSVTVVKYYLDGETIPYRTKIPATNVTLGQFKRFLGKRGKFRYFFKTLCQDFEDDAVQEEVMDDSAVLPLWNGIIECKVNAVPSDDESFS